MLGKEVHAVSPSVAVGPSIAPVVGDECLDVSTVTLLVVEAEFMAETGKMPSKDSRK